MKLNEQFSFYTDAAMLAIFDPLVLEHRKDDTDWFAIDFSTLPEVREGLISAVSLGSDGFYITRIADELSTDEKDYAREVTQTLGVVSQTGNIFIGQGECLPSYNDSPTPETLIKDPYRGKFINLPIGEYDLLVYSIDANGYASEEVVNSLPNLVVIIKKRTEKFHTIEKEPQLRWEAKTFLFPSARNKEKG
jgi:hypothetical protein